VLLIPNSYRPVSIRDKWKVYPLTLCLLVGCERFINVTSLQFDVSDVEKVKVGIFPLRSIGDLKAI
jgi:hypothetical protein